VIEVSVAEKFMNFIAREMDTVVEFLSTPMGIYEFRDKLIKNFRAFVMETLSGISPSKTILGSVTYRKSILRG